MAALSDQGQNVLAETTLQAFNEWLRESRGKLPHMSHQVIVATIAAYFQKKCEQSLVLWVGGRWGDTLVSSLWGASHKCLTGKLAYL